MDFKREIRRSDDIVFFSLVINYYLRCRIRKQCINKLVIFVIINIKFIHVLHTKSNYDPSQKRCQRGKTVMEHFGVLKIVFIFFTTVRY